MGLIFLLIRLLLSFILVRAAFARLAELIRSRQALRDSALPSALANLLSILLLLAKLATAVALLLTRTAWWGVLAASALFLLSAAGIGYNMVRRQPQRNQEGQQQQGSAGWSRLGRHLILAASAGFVVWQGQQQVGPGLLDWLTTLATVQQIALLVGVILFALLLLEGWVQFHALSQQGRMLLRIEALEAQLAADSIEKRLPAGSTDEQTDFAVGSAAPLLFPLTVPDGAVNGTSITGPEGGEPVKTPATPTSEEIELTIGMATYNDFDGVYFTLQALQLYHDLENTELLVIDNYGCDETQKLVEGWIGRARYIRATHVTGTAAPRDMVFREAQGNAVLCCDCHILFAPGAIARLKQFYRDHPDCYDLLQGPLLLDDKKNIATHFDPVWRAQMWGTWGCDPRGQNPNGEPFEIPMQGLGVFSCLKRAWLGFNPEFQGFGGEEGYIHEKFRQAGRRCLCLPWLLWMHRFSRPGGVKYPLTVEEKLRNYVIGHTELGLDLTPVLEHFAEHLPQDEVRAVTELVLGKPWAGTPLTSGENGLTRDKASSQTRRNSAQNCKPSGLSL